MELLIKAYIRNFRPMLTGASLAQDRGRMEARIEALTAEVSGLKKECQVNSLTAYVKAISEFVNLSLLKRG